MSSNATITIRLEDQPMPIAAGSTLAQLLEQLGHVAQEVSTAINGQFVPRSARDSLALKEQDQVLVFQAIVGG